MGQKNCRQHLRSPAGSDEFKSARAPAFPLVSGTCHLLDSHPRYIEERSAFIDADRYGLLSAGHNDGIPVLPRDLPVPAGGVFRAIIRAHIFAIVYYVGFVAGCIAIFRLARGERSWAKTERTKQPASV